MSEVQEVEQGSAEKSCLYRHFDAAGQLLYAGISLCAVGRLAQHRIASDWYAQIARVEVQWFASREEARVAEREAVRVEKPKHNVKLAVVPRNSRVQESRELLTKQVVRFKLLYSLKEAAETLGINARVLRRYVESGKLGTVLLLNTTGTASKVYVTGWQLIDFLEYLDFVTVKGVCDG